MTFSVLAVIMLGGLVGPLIAARQDLHLPLMLGELVAGIALGATGVRYLDSTDPTFAFIADIGFALIMFVAGSHVPVRDPALRTALRTGLARAGAVAVLAVIAAFAITLTFGRGNAGLYAVLMASSSAALILPTIASVGLGGPRIVNLLPQIAIADAACIIALPLVIDPAHVGRAAIGAGALTACGTLFFFGFRRVEASGQRKRLHGFSERRKFALELRVSLVILFALAALAVATHVSIMLAGFVMGLAVAAVGEPRRLTKQLFALTEGFLGPVFFIWLGASLNLRDLFVHPSAIGLGLALGVGAILTHTAMRAIGQPISLGMLAAAQLGVPVAAATVGTQLGLLAPGESSALILGAMITIGAAVIGGGLAAAAGFVSPARPAKATKQPSVPPVPTPPPDPQSRP